MVRRRQWLWIATAAALLTGTGGRGAETAPRDLADGELQLPHRPVWAGEVFDLTLAWHVDWARFQNLEGAPVWNPAPLIAESWQKPELSAPTGSSGGPATIAFRTRALALQPGSVRLQPARQTMVVQTGVYKTDEYERAVTGAVEASSQAVRLEVRPLPPAPDGFLGAVGRFKLESKVVPARVAVGQPITWSLVFAGVGNWSGVAGFPARQLSRAFDLASPPKVSEATGASLFERTTSEAVTLVPRQAGRFVLGPVETIVFDPARGAYVRLIAPAVTINVDPSGGAAENAAAAGNGTPPGGGIDPEATASAQLPRLLHSRGRTVPPLSPAAWTAALVVPALAVVGVWLMLAWWRAWEADPERLARAAHARLGVTLRRLAMAPDRASRQRLVRSWQKDVALRCKLEHAAPVPASFSGRDELQSLWAEADCFLYAEDSSLPDDWCARATRWWREQGAPPRFSHATMFRPANLYPVGCLLALAIGCWAPAPAAAEDAAISAWTQAVEREPLDWSAHYNLAVSLAAEDRWEEAAAHAGVAWLQQPTSEARAFWARSAKEAGYVAGSSYGIPLPDEWRGRLHGIAPIRILQQVVIGCVFLAAGGAILMLLVGYGRVSRRLRLLGLALLVGAGVAAASGGSVLYAYRPLLPLDAVLVSRAAPLRPLPVDTPAETEPELVQAGTVGRAGRAFLGWQRVRLADGRTGWLRQDRIVGVWGKPHQAR